MNLFLDTNLFLRFFTKDNKEMTSQAKGILSLAYAGKMRLATSTVVLTEIIYTLKTFYKKNRKDIIKHIEYILLIKNILLIDKTDFRSAFRLYRESGQKISDCLIISQVPANYKLCSFDKDLEKLIGKSRFVYPAKVKVN
jgi:predicted nucleic-acid-binding protein